MPANKVAFPRPDLFVLLLTITSQQSMVPNLTQTELSDVMDAGDDGDVLAYADNITVATNTAAYAYGGTNSTYGFSQYS